MKTKIAVIVSVGLLLVISYTSGYKRGYSVADAKDQADRLAEYRNDTNSDASLKHSPSYNFAYIHGRADGAIEARQRDITDCGDQLAGIVVRSGDTKEAGRLLASGYVTTEQLQTALNRKGAK